MRSGTKRSGQVSAPLVAAAALAVLTGCHHPEMQRCVDEQNRVVDQKFCQNLPQQTGINGSYQGGGLGFYPYHYYYGGGGGWYPGTVVYGGSTTSMSGHSYTTSSSAAHSTSGRAGVGLGARWAGAARMAAGGSEARVRAGPKADCFRG